MGRTQSPIWAITSYYNPFRGARRYANYQVFRKNLAIPLVTVEWSPEGDFQLAGDDADVLVQVAGGDLMWQKECLLNIALDHVPRASPYVAWIDCDLVFDDPRWPEKTLALLATHQVVQLYEEIRYLPECDAAQLDDTASLQGVATPSMKGIVSVIKAGMPFYADGQRPGEPGGIAGNPGGAYAAHVEWLRHVRFYDAGIVGGADRILIASLIDRLEESFASRSLAPAHMRHLREWVDRAQTFLPMQCAFLAGSVYHLYHGQMSNRKYRLRHAILTECDFDPRVHVSKTAQGVWQWTDEADTLKARVFEYLRSRDDA